MTSLDFIFLKFAYYIIMYYNYHATAKRLIKENKLIDFYFTANHNGIQPALVLVFTDVKHSLMPIRKERWQEYFELLGIKND